LRWTWTFFVLISFLPGKVREDGPSTDPPKKRGVTVEDMIAMTQWSDLSYFLGASPSTAVGIFSPDKRQFVVLVKKGILEQNTNEYSLLLFQTDEALQSPEPVTVARMFSSSYRPGIKKARWLADNKTVVFLGENAGELPAVYSVNVKTRVMKKLTHHSTAIVGYDTNRNGEVIVYEADPPQSTVDRRTVEKEGVVVSTQTPYELLGSGCETFQKTEKADKKLFVQIGDQQAVEIASPDNLTEYLPLTLDPTGKFAVLAVYVKDVPPAWGEYEDKGLHPYIVEKRKPGVRSNVQQYMLLDIGQRMITPFVDAPIPWTNSGLAWAPDGKSMVISGLFAPLDSEGIADRNVRKSVPMTLEVNVETKQAVEISRAPIRVLRWDDESGILTLEPGAKHGAEVATYRKGPSGWEAVSANTSLRTLGTTPMEISLEEDMNTPPRIMVRDPETDKKALLLDLNPQFAALTLASVEEIHWNALDGHEARGGLYLPSPYMPGRRYPLVIQTHGFNPKRFWMDGPWSGAFAAQALASRGFVVVQADETLTGEEYTKFWSTPEEAPHEMSAFEGLVDFLDRRGLVDRNRAGLIGFSRTVYHVAYTLTHSDYHFGAAVLADGFDGGYFSYLLYPSGESAAVNGGMPSGRGLEAWLKNSPSFNLDRVHTPIRVEGYGPGSLLGQWGWLTGLSTLGKPVELINLPYATHLLVRPWDRYVSEQGTVDWFSFWLLGFEDDNPRKGEQYRRWERLKIQADQPAK
jgi:dipeptidyl aminopeptidase/acylaminoacyl peptidase